MLSVLKSLFSAYRLPSLGLFFFFSTAYGQELKCDVTLNSTRIQGVDPNVFKNMESALRDFMNNRIWTSEVYGPEEKIECSITITITSAVQQDEYNATMIVQSSRPVFNSGYSSPMLNYLDKDCILPYVQNQTMDLNTQSYTNNLISILGFYAYIIIGLDAESFAKGGGDKYFALAEQIMNNVPTNVPEATGWRPFDATRNRYWLINNIQSSKYSLFKEALWDYHYAGLDNFYEKPDLARQNIMNALDKLSKLAADNPNGILLATFFQAKSDELVGIFSGAPPDEKTKALNYLRTIDPSNSSKYDKLAKN